MTEDIEKWREAGKKAFQLMNFASKLVKPEVPLLEIAEKIEQEAERLSCSFAFPINLSINEIAAHYSPSHDDKTIASGLLKVDMGVCIDGFISDIAKSFDLTAEQRYKDLIKASEDALKEAIKTIREEIAVCEVGNVIGKTITKAGFSPIINLGGHELKQYMLHAGLTIPNYNNNNKIRIEQGIYAIEPFATTGEGIVQDGKTSCIYMLENIKPVRDAKARELLAFIEQEYKTLPFSSRWLIKKFGTRALFSLRLLQQQECLHNFAELVEKSKMPVSQAECTVLVDKNGCKVLTQED